MTIKASQLFAPIDMPIEVLVAGLAKSKDVEALATAKRIDWEERITAKLGKPEDGVKTHTIEDGTKVTITTGFNFKADCEGIRNLFRIEDYDHGAPVRTKTKVELDEKAYKSYASAFPSIYKRIANFVTVTAKKTSVVLKAPKAK